MARWSWQALSARTHVYAACLHSLVLGTKSEEMTFIASEATAAHYCPPCRRRVEPCE